MAKKNRFVKLVDDMGAHEVAEVLGVPTNTVHQYRGRLQAKPDNKLSPHHIVTLCSHYEIPPYEFDSTFWPDKSWRF